MKNSYRLLLLAWAAVLALPAAQNLQAQAETNAAPQVEAPAEAEHAQASAASEATPDSPASDAGSRKIRHEALVVFGRDVELKEGETAEVVVAIGGSVKILGEVRGPAVAVGGDVDVQGEVRDAAVSVMGNLNVGPKAKIHGDAVSVAGRVNAAEGASVTGQITVMDIGPFAFDSPDWLKSWFRQCVMKARPLAPQVLWVWVVAGVLLLLYLLIAVVFRRPVHSSAEELTRRPATTFFLGILTLLLVPVILLILAATGLGLFVIPFLVAALALAWAFGKAALFEALGSTILRRFQAEPVDRPIVGFLIGFVVITILYMIPVVGMLTFLVTAVWSLGGAVAAGFGGMKRESPPKPKAIDNPPPTADPYAYAPSYVAGAPSESPTFSAAAMGGGSAAAASAPSVAAVAAPSLLPPQVPETAAYPRAGFWERMGAAFLDTVLVSLLGGLVGGPPITFLVALAYFAGMWTWKGTTIGGIVLGLKVVRLDQGPVTFAVSLVRALAGAFSIVVLFLGILWVAWDPEKQGWHDKIAGTAVLKLPRGTPLLCF